MRHPWSSGTSGITWSPCPSTHSSPPATRRPVHASPTMPQLGFSNNDRTDIAPEPKCVESLRNRAERRSRQPSKESSIFKCERDRRSPSLARPLPSHTGAAPPPTSNTTDSHAPPSLPPWDWSQTTLPRSLALSLGLEPNHIALMTLYSCEQWERNGGKGGRDNI